MQEDDKQYIDTDENDSTSEHVNLKDPKDNCIFCGKSFKRSKNRIEV